MSGMSSHGNLTGLVEQARNGSSEAWSEIYADMAPSIFRLCRRVLPTRQDAEDATSEVFLKARLRLAQYDATRPFQPWLFRIAANHCWDELRKRRAHGELQDLEAELSDLRDSAPSPQDAVLVNESKRNVRKAIAGLDDRSRLAVVLRYFSEMSYDEIGEVLGVSGNFVGVLLLRARQQLRKRLLS